MLHRRWITRATTALAGLAVAVTASSQELKTPSPIGLMSKVYFEDEFEGDQLANHWTVSNPEPEEYIVEDGVLLVIGKEVGGLENEATPNVFRLEKDLPKGDWTVTVKLNAEFQTGRDWLQFGLFSNPSKYVITSIYGNSWCCPSSSLMIRTKKKSGERVTHFENTVLQKKMNFQQFAETIPQPITLKLIKEGRVYRSAVHLEGQKSEAGEPVWVETDRVSLLRAPPRFVLNVSQWEEVKGESLFSIDSVTIETSEK